MSEEKEYKTNFTKAFSKYLKDIDFSKGITGIDPEYLEIFAESLGQGLKKSLWIFEEELNEDKYTKIKAGDGLEIQKLLDLGYSRVERVWNEGEISVLGDIVIIWPYSMKNVVRVSIFGDEIENIDVVDANTRKRIESVKEKILLPPNMDLVIGNEEADESVNIHWDRSFGTDALNVGIRSMSSLVDQLGYYKQRNFDVWYLTNNFEKSQRGKKGILGKIDTVYQASTLIEKNIGRGFVIADKNLVVLTDLEVLGEIDLSKYQEINRNIDPGSLEILKKVVPGDFLVHEDHGIGKFLGLHKRADGQYIEMGYAGKDKLFVPLSVADKLTKYIGAGKKAPRLTGLSSGVWRRISQKAQERAEEVAKELLQLYALREVAKSTSIFDSEQSLDDFWQFSNSFEFQDTEDQLLATKHVLEDFQRDSPMDRLLVGDVGFGKTEIAMRAIFSIANAGLQVAVLAPTTILVEQHAEVFKKRFKDHPFNISSLSRFSTEKERNEVIEGIKKGTIDIVVGTHSLLSKEIEFKDLGLLVIDEEQKFGVKQKEKIKSARVDTNVLSLTATPIPRTLNMALAGIRDISVLATPPESRKEIINNFGKFDWDEVGKAVQKELDRKGQVYFLHNRVGTIQSVYERLSKMFPHNSVEIAHGQMSTQELSKAMARFVKGDTDILVCTTIIENGLDIASANTLIIDDVSKLGLSQMYQIRGRVGRSKRQAYAYFFYDSLKGNSELRLGALRESQALGSGFILSNRDLEIRGAGDILGKNQSGAINSVGYGLYTQMLHDAVEDLKDNR